MVWFPKLKSGFANKWSFQACFQVWICHICYQAWTPTARLWWQIVH